MNATALIAEDEPLLALALQAELARAWPGLQVLATVGDGLSAVEQALALKPQVLFFDIRMPGLSGLEAAAELADAWDEKTPFPVLIFVTAYDEYAVQAFEVQAVDYVLKPVQAARLQKTVSKVQLKLKERATAAINSGSNSGVSLGIDAALPDSLSHTVAQLRHLLNTATSPASATTALPPLKVIQASVGNQIRMVPVDEVLAFEAADKYVRVLTAQREYLIRTPLKELLPQLDAQTFWQIHRGTVVRAEAIEAITRDEMGKQLVSLRGCGEKWLVSRLYAHLFKPM
jgi:DNA-binding LytR/AlgR family response regulator